MNHPYGEISIAAYFEEESEASEMGDAQTPMIYGRYSFKSWDDAATAVRFMRNQELPLDKRIDSSKIRMLTGGARESFPSDLKFGKRPVNADPDVYRFISTKLAPYIVLYSIAEGKPSTDAVMKYAGDGIRDDVSFDQFRTRFIDVMESDEQRNKYRYKVYYKSTMYIYYSLLSLLKNDVSPQSETYAMLMKSPEAQKESNKLWKRIRDFWNMKFNPLTSDRDEGYDRMALKWKNKIKQIDAEMETLRAQLKVLTDKKNRMLYERDDDLAKLDPNYRRKQYGANSLWNVNDSVNLKVDTGEDEGTEAEKVLFSF